MRWYVILGSVAVEGVLLAYAVLYMRVWRNQATLSTMERVNMVLRILPALLFPFMYPLSMTNI